MKPVIIIALAFVLLIPTTVFAQYTGNAGGGGLEEALELQRQRIEAANANPASGSANDSKCGSGTVFDTKTNACILLPDDESETKLASFVDENKDPWSYVDRYTNELKYKEWFDENYSEYSSIYEAVGLKTPLDFVDANKGAKYYIERYINEPSYKEWFDSNYPDYTISEAIGVPESTFNEILQSQNESISKHGISVESIILEEKILSPSQQNEVDILMHKAKAFSAYGYFDESFIHYEKAFQISNSQESKDGKDNIWNNIEDIAKDIKENPDELSGHGVAYLVLSDYKTALSLCSDLLNNASEDVLAFYCKLDALKELERYDDVLSEYSHYPHLVNKNMETVSLSSGVKRMESPQPAPKLVALYQLEKYDELIEYADVQYSFAEHEGFKKMFDVARAVSYEKLGKLVLSEIYFQESQIANYVTYDNNYIKGQSFLIFRDYPQAIKYLEKTSSDNLPASYAKVIAYYENERQSPVKQIGKIIPSSNKGGGCLIATATYGSELAPEVQKLRELRDNSLLTTTSGSNFMNFFNDVYYSFSPYIADYERENPVFKEMVKLTITPLLSSLSIMQYAESDSEVLGIGISVIMLNIGMYFGIPAIVIVKLKQRL